MFAQGLNLFDDQCSNFVAGAPSERNALAMQDGAVVGEDSRRELGAAEVDADVRHALLASRHVQAGRDRAHEDAVIIAAELPRHDASQGTLASVVGLLADGLHIVVRDPDTGRLLVQPRHAGVRMPEATEAVSFGTLPRQRVVIELARPPLARRWTTSFLKEPA